MQRSATQYLRRLWPRRSKTVAIAPRPRRERLVYDEDAFAAIYAVGDVHGCYEKLLSTMTKIRHDAAHHPGPVLVVLLGDYVDRGPRSCDVLQFLTSFHDRRVTLVPLCGNHDDAFLRLLENPAGLNDWLKFAGDETLASYGIEISRLRRNDFGQLGQLLAESVPLAHRNLLQSLPITVRIANLLFVHAGIRPGIPLEAQIDADLMWIREPFLAQGPRLPLTVIHGHTPVKTPFFGEGRICIDTAAYASGRLTALKIAGQKTGILA